MTVEARLTEIETSKICAQSVFNFEQHNANSEKRIYYSMCTDGFLFILERYFGSMGYIGKTTTTADMIWFFKIEHTIPTFYMEQPNAGTGLHELVDAVKKGAEVNIFVSGSSVYKQASSIHLSPDSSFASVQTIWMLSRKSGETFPDNPYWFMEIRKTTTHLRQIARYTVDSSDSVVAGVVPTAITNPMKWYANTRWKLVFETDLNGTQIYGSKSSLICLVRHGHRVRIGVDNVYEEASAMWIKNEELYAQTLDSMLSSDDTTFDSVPHRVVQMVCTSGWVEEYHIHLHGGQHYLHLNGTSHLRWFVDLDDWTVANTNGMYHYPSADLRLLNGAWIRFLLEISGVEIALNANSVETAGDPRIIIKSFKQFDVSLQICQYRYISPPTWVFYYAAATGRYIEHSRRTMYTPPF